jgi:hypothetical protein
MDLSLHYNYRPYLYLALLQQSIKLIIGNSKICLIYQFLIFTVEKPGKNKRGY